jgi:trigger factor
MKVVIEDVSTVTKKMNIQIEPEIVALELAKEVMKKQRTAKVPGFRADKATKDAIERHHGEEIKAEALKQLVADAVEQAEKEHDLIAVTMPAISDVSELHKDKVLTFTATVDVRPKVELGTYTGIEIKDQPVSVNDEEVEDTVKRLREMYARLDDVEGQPLTKEHTAILDLEAFQGGKPLANTKATDFMLHLGMDLMLPEFEDQLAGMQKGETREIKVTFPQDYATKEIAGKDVTFTVTVKDVKKKVLPELDEEFLQTFGQHKSVDELKARLRGDLEARKRSELVTAQKDDLLAKLIDAHAFDVPDSLVDQVLNYMVQQQALFLQSKGADVQKTFDVKDFKKENREMAVKRVKGIVILQDIAEKESLKISDEDVSAAMATMARNSGQKLEQIFKYDESQAGGLDSLRESLLAQKTLAFLFARAKMV